MTNLTAQNIRDAIAKWPSRYRTREGREVVGDCVSRVSGALRDAGWRRVPRLEASDLRQLGLEIVEAEYVNGGRPTGKFVDVVVIRESDPEAAIKRDYADLGVTCGYIGNITCGPVEDYRSFYVFTTLATKPGASACDISVHIFDVPRAHKGIWTGKIEFDTPAVRAKLDAIRERFQRGELFDLRTK
jgi:hypothetical protein